MSSATPSTNKLSRYVLSAAGIILVGLLMAALAILANNLSTQWRIVILISLVAPSVVLLVRDIRQLILIVFVVDIALVVDIAIQNQGAHRGGPTGYLISMTTIVLIVGYAIWFIERRPKMRFYPVTTLPILVYLGTVVFSLYQSGNLQLSMFGLFLEVQLFLFYYYLANHVRTWNDLQLVMATTAGMLLAESLLMVAQYFLGFNVDLGFIRSQGIQETGEINALRVAGTLSTPNSAGAYLSAMMVLVLTSYATTKLIDSRLALPALGFGALALTLTLTRSAWGSFVLGALITLPWLLRLRTGRQLVPLMLLGVIVVGVLFSDQIAQRLTDAQTDTTRQELAYMANNIIDAFPMGIGQNTYDQVMSYQYAHPNMVGHTLYVVHNKYLLVWAETGIQGLIAFILLLLAAAWQTIRRLLRKDLAMEYQVIVAGLLGALAGYAYHMSTEGFASRGNLQILWFLIALIAAISYMIDDGEMVPGASESTKIGAR